MTGTAVAAPASYVGGNDGANALALSVSAPVPEQPPLFHPPAGFPPSQKIIPFEQIPRQAAGRSGPVDFQPSAPAATKPPRAPTKKSAPLAGQANFDFRPGDPQGERILATGVPAQVYGEGRVAPPMRRLTAGAMDVSMVLLGFGVFAVTARFSGSAFGGGRAGWVVLALSLFLISLFYGLLWAMARRETAGMHWTQLHLVTFDGSPLDGRNRAVRFVSAWLSYCSGGLGLLWALADEENLAFHDHISKTYPAEKGATSAFVKAR